MKDAGLPESWRPIKLCYKGSLPLPLMWLQNVMMKSVKSVGGVAGWWCNGSMVWSVGDVISW